MKNNVSIYNRKGKFEYFLVDEYKAGISLVGCEVKSIRKGDANIGDAYCVFENNELYLKNSYIAPYENAGFKYRDYDPKRDRKLLLTKKELKHLHQDVKTKGYTIVPIEMYSDEKGRIKIKIFLAKGKHTYDKSQAIKERDLDRMMYE